MKKKFAILITYGGILLKWGLLSGVLGILSGVLGSVFHLGIDHVTTLRFSQPRIILLLPFGGVFIAWLYSFSKKNGKIDTNRVLLAARGDESVPFRMTPMIFISTVITHLLGGSAGREGAALQLGGSVGYNLGKTLRLTGKSMRILVRAGMSGVFSALFGTPITAAVFSGEVVNVGMFHYASFVPSVISAVTAYMVSRQFGISGVRFPGIPVEALNALSLVQISILALLSAFVSILFCVSIHKCEKYMQKYFSNPYLRALTGGIMIVLFTILLKTQAYNGTGMDGITAALGGEARGEAFLLKILFTAVTIAAGFRGGEIVPAFFVGSTFGCFIGPFLGLNPAFAAAIGFIALFCGVVNCPLASIILSIEVFGAEGLLFFALACGISYIFSGNFGLYHSQRIVYEKLDDECTA